MSPSTTPPLDPKVDIVFRALFGTARNADLTRSLLNGILQLRGKDAITELEHLNPLMDIRSFDDKEPIVDVAVRDRQRRHYVIEMQCLGHPSFRPRMLYYAARR